MARSKIIRVTPNVKRCLSILKKSVKAMPDGEEKNEARAAVNYLDKTFKGTPQPARGQHCPTLQIIY